MDLNTLKVAIVHDVLDRYGGAEKVLEALLDTFPQANLFVSQDTGNPQTANIRQRFNNFQPTIKQNHDDHRRHYEEQSDAVISSDVNNHSHGGENVTIENKPTFGEQSEQPYNLQPNNFPTLHTTFIQKLPFKRILAKFYTPLLPYAFESLDLSDYDVIISSTAHFAKAVITSPEQLHICYCHTPPRFLYHYPTETSIRKHPILKHIVAILDNKLRQFDFEAAQRPDILIANSNNTKRRIEKFYRREAKVIYPPVEIEKFASSRHCEEEIPKVSDVAISPDSQTNKDKPTKEQTHVLHRYEGKTLKGATPRHCDSAVAGVAISSTGNQSDYFLFISRLLPYKNIDPIIDAFNELNKKLVIVGEGSERERLQQKAKRNIEFTGFVSDEKLVNYMQNAKAFIFNVKDEDFGIVMVEALAAGTPVIAFNGGGAKEIVQDGVNGILYDNGSKEGIEKAIKRFLDIEASFDKEAIQESATKFSKQRFMDEIKELVTQNYKK